jgi:hypothetical protein
MMGLIESNRLITLPCSAQAFVMSRPTAIAFGGVIPWLCRYGHLPGGDRSRHPGGPRAKAGDLDRCGGVPDHRPVLAAFRRLSSVAITIKKQTAVTGLHEVRPEFR